MIRNFSQLQHHKIDILVVGGGIYGAWTAYDAALRGLKVAIVDKGDWACATSSASSKLIHGGLRYLETLDISLVKKSLAERQMLLQIAPHRVWPLRFGVPYYASSRIGWFRFKIGLSLYDFLAGNLPKDQKHQSHSKAHFIEQFSYLNPFSLQSGFTYFDAQTDDARFVLELIDGASSAGAICVNYCELIELVEKNGKLCGAVLSDKVTNETLTIDTNHIVDTTGRWSHLYQDEDVNYRLTKGIHLIMPKILKDQSLLITASDGRVIFLIPWYGMTLLGTTDTNYDGDIDNLPVTDGDIDYLLTEANLVLKDLHWTHEDIVGTFAGLRVLQQSKTKNPTGISRDWTLKTSKNGLLSSIGGKFTSAREDASIIVDTLCERLDVHTSCQTQGKFFPWLPESGFQWLLKTSLPEAHKLGIDSESADWLVKRHANRIGKVFDLCKDNPDLTKRIKPELPFIKADLVFCAQDEMVIHLEDLLRRRMPLLIIAKLTKREIQDLGKLTARILGWDTKKTNAEIVKCLK